jgi:hypothetical protein
MNTTKTILSALVLFMTCVPCRLFAFGIGAYGTVSSDLALRLNSGGGVIIDTNCAGKGIFNNRLSIGWSTPVYSRDGQIKRDKGSALTSDISLVNTFGFGLVRREYFRFWLGPGLGMHSHYYRYNPKPTENFIYDITAHSWEYFPVRSKTATSLFGVSLGLALGGNINCAHDITLSIEAGARYYFYYGITQYELAMLGPFHIRQNTRDMKFDTFISFAVLYRVNDSYTAAETDNK